MFRAGNLLCTVVLFIFLFMHLVGCKMESIYLETCSDTSFPSFSSDENSLFGFYRFLHCS